MKYITKIGTLENVPATNGYQVEYETLWADGTGRTMDGTFSGTRIGIFPKITATFPPLSQTTIKNILAQVTKTTIELTWYDLKSSSYKTSDFYVSGASAESLFPERSINKESTIVFIALKRM